MKQTLIFLFISFNLFGQQNETLLKCGADEMRINWLKSNPQYQPAVLKREIELNQFTEHFALHKKSTSGPYVIPVVFHVIHNYGVENISDAQILDGLRVLNNYFNKNSADSIEVIPAFKPLMANCEIEFRLAKKDPNGNCTKGINRIASYLTNIGDHQVKSLVHWPPTKYLNIYVVSNAAGLAGHCIWPADADTIPQWDGIVIGHNYVGSIGTANTLRQVTLSHEAGHYLNLQHTWGGNNVPGFYYLPCADPNKDCNIDDGVADTPTTIGWQTCNLNGASCGSPLDNVQNMMEYTYCNRMFTHGQKQRMHACLNSSIAGRNNLWSAQNLIETGTDGSAQPLCAAEFRYTNPIICTNRTVTFTNTSYNGIIDSVLWRFEGGSPSISKLNEPTITYPSIGDFDVTLIAYSNGDSVKTTINNLVQVTSSNAPSGRIFLQDFNTPFNLRDSNYITINYDSANTFELRNNFGYNNSGCLWFNNFTNPTKQKDEIISPTLNLSGLSNVTISFKYAFAQRTPTNNDKLTLFISKDCGITWTSRWSTSGNSLKTTDTTSSNFYPTNPTQWRDISISSIPAVFYNDGIKLKFTFESDGGNNLFIDDWMVNFTTHTEDNKTFQDLKVYPQPANNFLTVEKATSFNLKLFNLQGQLLYAHPSVVNNLNLDISPLANGLYLLEIETIDQIIKRKIVIQR